MNNVLPDEVSHNFNVPNTITGGRGAIALGEAAAYAVTGDVRHFLGAGAAFLLDIVDGPAARRLNQVTEFGADFDPFVDKASIIAIAAATAIQGTGDIAPLVAVGAVNASNIAAAFVARKRGVDSDVTPEGKRSQFRMNSGYGIAVLGNHLRKSERPAIRATGHVLRYAGNALAIGTALNMGARTSVGYWRQALKPKK